MNRPRGKLSREGGGSRYTVRMNESADISTGTGEEARFLMEVLRAESDGVARIADAVEAQIATWTAALDVLQACSGHAVISGMGC